MPYKIHALFLICIYCRRHAVREAAMEIFSWEAFEKTGSIDAYLLYKLETSLRHEEVSKKQWQTASEQKELS